PLSIHPTCQLPADKSQMIPSRWPPCPSSLSSVVPARARASSATSQSHLPSGDLLRAETISAKLAVYFEVSEETL
ncbi:hypothetical protein PMAYCL1PPCAC_10265, partial [Pristionchus mayeri]